VRKNKTVQGAHIKSSHNVIDPSCGSLRGKFPVVLDGGKTTIYISDKSREAEIIERYNSRTRR
jgi:hypothetical protein